MPRPRSLRSLAMPAAAALVLAGMLGSGARPFLVVAVVAVVFAAADARLARGPRAAAAALFGTVAIAGGAIAASPLAVAGGTVALVAGLTGAWGVNRGRPALQAWALRGLTALGAVFTLFLVVYPTLLAVDYLAKPRSPIRESAFAGAHQRVSFPASDGVRLAGWWAPGRRDAAVVVVHGGGGDREGAVTRAQLLARAGYGVLLYDARGRGQSGGHANAFGWEWHRDVRGAVDFVRRQGASRVGLFGISTGAEAVVTEAAGDPRVRAVVADGAQGRTAKDASVLPFGDRMSVQPLFTVLGAEIRALRGESPPPFLKDVVRRAASERPVLLIGTGTFERSANRAYVRGTHAQLWELPRSGHTKGLEDHPRAYTQRVLRVFDASLR